MAFTKIDLSKLPGPAIIQEALLETVLAEIKADFLGRYDGQLLDLESEPVIKLLEVAAYREVILVNRINQGAAAVMVATSTGTDLDNLAAIIPLSRFEGELDDAFRARIQLAPEGFSTAGSRGAYEFHAKSASPDVIDVYIGEPVPGSVDVYILGPDATASAALLTAVNDALSDDVVPLNDLVTVKPFVHVDYSIEAHLTFSSGLGTELVREAAAAAVNGYVQERRKFGRSVTRAGIVGALVIEGVENVALISPVADVHVLANEVARLTILTVLGADDV